MNCENCGTKINEDAKFCKNCGEAIGSNIIGDNINGETIEYKEKPKTDSFKNIEKYTQEFVEYIIDVIKKPVLGKKELRSKLDETKVYMLLPIIILINAIVVSLQFKLVQKSVMRASIGFMEGFDVFGIGDFLRGFSFIQQTSVIKNQIFLPVIFFAILGLSLFGVYKVLMKMDITFIDTLRMALNTIIILTVSNIIGWVVGLVSLQLLFLVLAITMLLFTIMVVTQVFRFVGLSAKVIYTIPVIYILGIYLSLNLYSKVF